MILDSLPTPIVLAPLAGGPSTPALTAAVAAAGGFPFLAGGYLSATELARRIEQTAAMTDRPFGVNLFVPGKPANVDELSDYAARVAALSRPSGVEPGALSFDDDDWADKLHLAASGRIPVLSFTFGCPEASVIDHLHNAGAEAWVTVTRPEEAAIAERAGADVLVVQGSEAGGHRGSFLDRGGPSTEIALLPLLQLVSAVTALPLVAAGGIGSGQGIAGVLATGAVAAALGTAFLLCPEAGTNQAARDVLQHQRQRPTVLTRAFTGRLARGIENDFIDELEPFAPVAYPEVHHLTAPLRQAGRASRNPELVNLWAGQAYPLGRDEPAGTLVARLWRETREALDAASRRGQARPDW